jgi:hypothetical protein
MKREDFIRKYEQKIYIDDSVYARFDGYHIILETHNGYSDDPRNQIALEPPVMDNLEMYRKQIYEDAKEIE